ncbi:MAG: CoB--CoM heterodisulfide reductase iron-sulfur subunit A family protein [Candidatus Thorarchaeota archaeon]|nr:CoB--CoM heterodisulfide reductase iron-sulfur subunit A family protein [Candidatus Thorarchaeota archaeon]
MPEPRIGIFICHCGSNIAGVVDIGRVLDEVKNLPNVVHVEDYKYLCSRPGQQIIKDRINEMRLDRVVIGSCSPRMHELTFRQTMREGNLNPFLLEIANLREQNSWIHQEHPEAATEKAIDLIRMAVARARLLEPLEETEVAIEKSSLVIGGGIAGISAALDMADAGFKVYIVEKEPSIGGKMARWDKTFPTLDCASCILTPRMAETGSHPNIELLTMAEVDQVEGFVGNFEVTIKQRPRYVDIDKCTSCGDCSDVCPVDVPAEFDANLTYRKAIYIPFAQAVPSAYLLDMDNCLGVDAVRCGKCKEACGAEAINYDDQEKTIKIKVGTIIVATGFDLFDATKKEEYGYGEFPNVVNIGEVERMLSSAGPTQGHVVRPSDLKEPKRIVYVQCVGSRDERTNRYCSRVCCMTAIKQARMIRDKLGAEIYIFYIDLRTFGKGYEEFYESTAAAGVNFIRGRVGEILQDDETHSLTVRGEDTLLGKPVNLDDVDLVVLSTGVVPPESAKKVRHILNLSQSPDGFLLEAHPKLRPVDSFNDGIFVAGMAQGPKDIPDTVAQAKAAAAGAMALMGKGKISIEPYYSIVDENKCSGCRVCVSVCPYNAITINEREKANVNPALCKGCGTCTATCPSGAITSQHYTDGQILAMINEYLSGTIGAPQE